MTSFLFFLKVCFASKTLVGSLCGLLIVPLGAWLAFRVLAPFIRRMDDDPAWQAPLAAAASSASGVVFLLLAIAGLFGAYGSGCLQFVWGRILFAAILALAILAIARASTIAYRRYAQVHRLVRQSRVPSAGVARLATSAGVRVRVIPFSEPFCALAQPLQPLVLLSAGTLERLNEKELEAALLHERAHARRGDLVLSFLVSFFADLLPLPNHDLTATYNGARELAADECAVRVVEPHWLASAILALAGAGKLAPSLAALAEESATLRQRIFTLLEDRAKHPGIIGRRAVALGGLVIVSALSLTPPIMALLNFYGCTFKGMAS